MKTQAVSLGQRGKVFRICDIALVVILVLLPLNGFLTTWAGTAIGPLELWKGLKEVVLALMLAAILVAAIWIPKLRAILQENLVMVVGIYALLALLLTLLGSANTEAQLAGVVMDLRYFLAFIVAYAVLRMSNSADRWMRHAPKFLVAAGVVLSVLGILQVTVISSTFLENFGYDAETTISPVSTVDDNENYERAYATTRGPNDYAAYLLLPLLTAFALIQTNKKYWFAFGLILLAIGLSSSRSAWIAVVVMFSVWFALQHGRTWFARPRVIAAGFAGLVIIAAMFAAVLEVPALRITLLRSSPGDSSLFEGSTANHFKFTANGIGRVIDDPVTGCGAGCAGPASFRSDEPRISENYYVQVAETYGLVGLLLWLGIFVYVLRQLYRRREDLLPSLLFASGIGIASIGVWLHVWADDPVSLTWWMLAAACLVAFDKSAKSEYDKRKHGKETATAKAQ